MFYCLLSPVISLKPRTFTQLLIAPQDSTTARTLSTDLHYSMSHLQRYLDSEAYHSPLSIAWSYVLSKIPAAQAGSNLA